MSRAPVVKLSARERAINVLNDAPRHVDTRVCAAFAEADAQRDALRARVAELEAQLAAQSERLAAFNESLDPSAVPRAVAEEREACAMVADPSDTIFGPEATLHAAIAAAIRARGGK